MELVDLIPASVYNKSFSKRTTKKQELPEYQAENCPKYEIDFLKERWAKFLLLKLTAY